MPLSRRTRDLPMLFPQADIVNYKGQPEESIFRDGRSVTVATGNQITDSESHHYDRFKGRWDGGGPFYTDKLEYFGHYPEVHLREVGSGRDLSYDGPVLSSFPSVSDIEAVGGGPLAGQRSSDTSDLDPDGATAIAQCSPANPNVNLLTTLAEVHREGIPSLPGIQSWKKRTEIARAAGSEYLNYEFGWAPLVSEVANTRDAVIHHVDILKQHHHDTGRNTKREFGFPVDRRTYQHEFEPVSDVNLAYATGFFIPAIGVWNKTVVRTIERRKWFSGMFTQAVPSQSDSWQRALGYHSDAYALFGIALTPDVLWELTPWSWAVDWFSNAGDVIQNVTNFGLAGQVMRYGYMMEESIDEVTTYYTARGTSFVPSGTVLEQGKRRVSKVRRPANPFGFGIGWEGLSPSQLAITAALGITRLL